MESSQSAGSGGHAGAGNGAGGNHSGGSGGSSDGCVQTVVHTQRTQPTVILIVDQSGSMTATFDQGTRWDVLQNSLLAKPNGLVAQLQSQVRFGLALYSADSATDDDGAMVAPGDECPRVQEVGPALNNYDSIATLYRSQHPFDDTPTGDSIDAVVKSLDLKAHPSTEQSPIIFVLATDGEPDRCENLDPNTETGAAAARMESVMAVTHAFEKNIRTYVIAVGNDVTVQHQQAVANAGIGRISSDPAAPYWRPNDDQSLRDALTQIVGGEISCDIALDGSVQGNNPCLGTVELDGDRLECNGPDGWQLSDSQHIRLLGDACTHLKGDVAATVSVSFPCAVEVIFPD